MKRFGKIVNGYQLLTIFVKRFIFDVWKGLNTPLLIITNEILIHFYHVHLVCFFTISMEWFNLFSVVLFLWSFLMRFIADNNHILVAMVVGTTKCNFANLSNPDINSFCQLFLMESFRLPLQWKYHWNILQ